MSWDGRCGGKGTGWRITIADATYSCERAWMPSEYASNFTARAPTSHLPRVVNTARDFGAVTVQHANHTDHCLFEGSRAPLIVMILLMMCILQPPNRCAATAAVAAAAAASASANATWLQ